MPFATATESVANYATSTANQIAAGTKRLLLILHMILTLPILLQISQ